MKRPWIARAAVTLSSGLAAAVALGALNHAAHPGAWVPRVAWAVGGLLAAAAAVVLAGKKATAA